MKCFERLVKSFITSSLPDSLDPLQFAYRANRPTDNAITLTLHTATLPSLIRIRGTHVTMLFIDYSSAFNTIVPSKLAVKLRDLGLNTALCDCILSFLRGRPQAVRIGRSHHPPWLSTPAHPRAVCWALSSTPCSPMTAWILNKKFRKFVQKIYGI